MKSLSKIFVRYLMTAAIIILVTLFLNLALFFLTGWQIINSSSPRVHTSREIAAELQETSGTVSLSDVGYQYLKQGYSWAMLLDDSGQVCWNWNLPSELNHTYTPNEIAAFSKWYLDDYPVTERATDEGLLVLAAPKGSLWKHNDVYDMNHLNHLIFMVPVTLIADLIFVFLLSLFMGFLFYRSLRAIAVGIERLSEQKPIHLPEKGITEMLARQLNRTSDILTDQKKRLDQRDDARTNWISGVSHDIRTPLSLIMGYASALKEDSSLSEVQRHQAELIEFQSLQIKRLIEDLNLTSRLEYEMQPLRPADFQPSRLLRKIVSDFYNQGLSDSFVIELYIDPEVEQMTLTGDTALLERAFRNLIQNSIRHNPGGCTVTVTVRPEKEGVRFRLSDDGCGIPERVIQSLNGTLPETEKAPHIMGLRIVWQILKAHGWEIMFADERTICIFYVPETAAKVRCPREKPTKKAEAENKSKTQ